MRGQDAKPLYAWQEEALDAWRSAGRRGIVQAVTGAGKTILALEAIREVVEQPGQKRALVIVPTIELQTQWCKRIRDRLPGVRIGRLGGGHKDDLVVVQILVAVVNSLRKTKLRPPAGSLIVGDECHRYGSEFNSLALDERFDHRLGLSATYERDDDGHLSLLIPYFGEPCYDLGYERALADDVVAHFKIALVGVRFTPEEAHRYDIVNEIARDSLAWLITYLGFSEPFGEVMKRIGKLSEGSADYEAQREARRYLKAFSDRVKLLSDTHAKLDVLETLAPAVTHSNRSLVFTMRKSAAEEAATILSTASIAAGTPLVIRELHSGLAPDERAARMADFEGGYVKALVAPRVLDEGVDVPDADLGIILATSRSRRQMVQRMGRVLRPKDPPRRARFAVIYVEGTIEDPRTGAHEAFLDEIAPLADDAMISRPDADRRDVVEFLSTTTVRPNVSVADVLRPARDAADISPGQRRSGGARPPAPPSGPVWRTRTGGRGGVGSELEWQTQARSSDTQVYVDADDYSKASRAQGAPYHFREDCPKFSASERRVTTTVHIARTKRMVACKTCKGR